MKRIDLFDLCIYFSTRDIHRAWAALLTGKPAEAVTAEERGRAKAVLYYGLYSRRNIFVTHDCLLSA